jgi:hypothetical protein
MMRDSRVRIAAETRNRQSRPRTALIRRLPDLVVSLCVLFTSTSAGAQGSVGLENSRLRLSFDRKTGTLVAIENKLAAETCQIRGDECGFEAVEFRTAFADLKLVSLGRQGEVVNARYQAGPMAVEASYTLRGAFGDRGWIFLFNPSKNALTGEFALTEERIGLRATGTFQVSQEYPLADRKIIAESGKMIRWELPPTTAVVLRIQPVTQ